MSDDDGLDNGIASINGRALRARAAGDGVWWHGTTSLPPVQVTVAYRDLNSSIWAKVVTCCFNLRPPNRPFEIHVTGNHSLDSHDNDLAAWLVSQGVSPFVRVALSRDWTVDIPSTNGSDEVMLYYNLVDGDYVCRAYSLPVGSIMVASYCRPQSCIGANGTEEEDSEAPVMAAWRNVMAGLEYRMWSEKPVSDVISGDMLPRDTVFGAEFTVGEYKICTTNNLAGLVTEHLYPLLNTMSAAEPVARLVLGVHDVSLAPVGLKLVGATKDLQQAVKTAVNVGLGRILPPLADRASVTVTLRDVEPALVEASAVALKFESMDHLADALRRACNDGEWHKTRRGSEILQDLAVAQPLQGIDERWAILLRDGDRWPNDLLAYRDDTFDIDTLLVEWEGDDVAIQVVPSPIVEIEVSGLDPALRHTFVVRNTLDAYRFSSDPPDLAGRGWCRRFNADEELWLRVRDPPISFVAADYIKNHRRHGVIPILSNPLNKVELETIFDALGVPRIALVDANATAIADASRRVADMRKTPVWIADVPEIAEGDHNPFVAAAADLAGDGIEPVVILAACTHAGGVKHFSALAKYVADLVDPLMMEGTIRAAAAGTGTDFVPEGAWVLFGDEQPVVPAAELAAAAARFVGSGVSFGDVETLRAAQVPVLLDLYKEFAADLRDKMNATPFVSRTVTGTHVSCGVSSMLVAVAKILSGHYTNVRLIDLSTVRGIIDLDNAVGAWRLALGDGERAVLAADCFVPAKQLGLLRSGAAVVAEDSRVVRLALISHRDVASSFLVDGFVSSHGDVNTLAAAFVEVIPELHAEEDAIEEARTALEVVVGRATEAIDDGDPAADAEPWDPRWVETTPRGRGDLNVFNFVLAVTKRAPSLQRWVATCLADAVGTTTTNHKRDELLYKLASVAFISFFLTPAAVPIADWRGLFGAAASATDSLVWVFGGHVGMHPIAATYVLAAIHRDLVTLSAAPDVLREWIVTLVAPEALKVVFEYLSLGAIKKMLTTDRHGESFTKFVSLANGVCGAGGVIDYIKDTVGRAVPVHAQRSAEWADLTIHLNVLYARLRHDAHEEKGAAYRDIVRKSAWMEKQTLAHLPVNDVEKIAVAGEELAYAMAAYGAAGEAPEASVLNHVSVALYRAGLYRASIDVALVLRSLWPGATKRVLRAVRMLYDVTESKDDFDDAAYIIAWASDGKMDVDNVVSADWDAFNQNLDDLFDDGGEGRTRGRTHGPPVWQEHLDIAASEFGS